MGVTKERTVNARRVLPSEARAKADAVPQRPLAPGAGWTFVLLPVFDRRPSRTRRYLILVPRPRFPETTGEAQRPPTEPPPHERRRGVCFQARHERKQTPCRSGRLLTDGVAVRCSASRGTGEVGGMERKFKILGPTPSLKDLLSIRQSDRSRRLRIKIWFKFCRLIK